jgi:hypothetical protein
MGKLQDMKPKSDALYLGKISGNFSMKSLRSKLFKKLNFLQKKSFSEKLPESSFSHTKLQK